MNTEKKILIDYRTENSKSFDIIIRAESVRAMKQIEDQYFARYSNPKSKFLILATEIIQNIIKHSTSEENGYVGINFNNEFISINGVNQISDKDIIKIKSELDLINNSSKKTLKNILKKRMMSFDLPGNGIIQIFLKSSQIPELKFIKLKNKNYFLIKTKCYVG